MRTNNNLRSISHVKVASVVPNVNSTLSQTVIAFFQGLSLVWPWNLPLKWDVEVCCLMVLLNVSVFQTLSQKKMPVLSFQIKV